MTCWIDLSHCMRVVDSQERLEEIYQTDFYWYLKTDEFKKEFLYRIAGCADYFGKSILDVGCGEAQLASCIPVAKYVGIDGSPTALLKSRESNPKLDVRFGRIEYPWLSFAPNVTFDTIVFGGILEVLVKAEKRIEFVSTYLNGFNSKGFVIYDLQRLDVSGFDNTFERVFEYKGSVNLPDLLPEVKRRRKVLAYKI